MNTKNLLDPTRPSKAWISLGCCLLVLLAVFILASFVQRDFGNVEVTNVVYENFNGIVWCIFWIKVIGVLILVIPKSPWFYQLTGKIYLGAIHNALLVDWMFTSSQVIAPIPV